MARRAKLSALWPAAVALVVSLVYVAWRLAEANWDPVALAEIGRADAGGAPDGRNGYDGQFAYFMAVDLDPVSVSSRLDVPAYRYQRILLPLLARGLALGQPDWIPWTLVLVNLVAHTLGTAAVARVLDERGLWPGYALAYGCWVGLVAGVGLDLHEPLAYALVAAGWLAHSRNRPALSGLLIGASLFAKETALLFWAALLLGSVLTPRQWRSVAYLSAAGVAFAAWQIALYRAFGAFGLGSGGAMATPFEWIPFMGLWRIGSVSWAALGLFVVIFGPTIVMPSVWGAIASARALWSQRASAEGWALLLNSASIAFLPHSTFREPLGLVRFACGLVLATLLFSSSREALRPLRYALFWIALLAMLLNR